MTLVTGTNSSTPKPKLLAGFTLLELMVVLMIIGLLTYFVTAQFPENSERERLHTETLRLSHLLTFAAEESTIKSRVVGVRFAADQYSFLTKNAQGEWQTHPDRIFRTRALPARWTVELATLADQYQKVRAGVDLPQVILSPSGEVTPFGVRFIGVEGKSHYEIKVSLTGQVSVETVASTP